MKRLLWAILLASAFGQTTPNLNLNIPTTGTLNWGALMNANFTSLDGLLGGTTSTPLTIQTLNANSLLSYNLNNQAFVDGVHYPCTDAGAASAAATLPIGGTVHLEACAIVTWAASRTFGGASGSSSPGITLTYDVSKTRINITESDGGCPINLGNGSGVLGIGPGFRSGSGVASDAGFFLAATANVTGIFCNADTSGAQEDAFVERVVAGSVISPNAATVAKGIIYFKQMATNTYIMNNNLVTCPNACIWLENIGGQAKVENNWINVQSGSTAITGSGLIIRASGAGPGCKIAAIHIQNNTIEHAGGSAANSHEIDVAGDDAGSLACQINFSDNYIERTNVSPAPNISVRIRDCENCTFKNVSPGGTGTGTDFINLSESAANLTAGFRIENLGIDKAGAGPPYTNILNDTIDSLTYTSASVPWFSHWVQPGTATYLDRINLGSALVSTGPSATLSGTGACATITTQLGGSFAGTAKCTGTTGASTLTITPGATAPNGWICRVQDETTRANLFQQTSHTTTACTMTITSVTSNDVFVFDAFAF